MEKITPIICLLYSWNPKKVYKVEVLWHPGVMEIVIKLSLSESLKATNHRIFRSFCIKKYLNCVRIVIWHSYNYNIAYETIPYGQNKKFLAFVWKSLDVGVWTSFIDDTFNVLTIKIIKFKVHIICTWFVLLSFCALIIRT